MNKNEPLEKHIMCLNLLQHDYPHDLIKQLLNKKFNTTDGETVLTGAIAIKEIKDFISKTASKIDGNK